MIYSGFEARVSDRLLPGYNEPSMALDALAGSWVLNYDQPACFRELRTAERYEHVDPFLGKLLT